MVFCSPSLPNLVFVAQLLVFSSSVEGSNSLLGWYSISKKSVKKQLLQEGLILPGVSDTSGEQVVLG